MFLRKVGERWAFFFKNRVFIEKNLDFLACFSVFWRKKWWISEKEFGSRNIEKLMPELVEIMNFAGYNFGSSG